MGMLWSETLLIVAVMVLRITPDERFVGCGFDIVRLSVIDVFLTSVPALSRKFPDGTLEITAAVFEYMDPYDAVRATAWAEYVDPWDAVRTMALLEYVEPWEVLRDGVGS